MENNTKEKLSPEKYSHCTGPYLALSLTSAADDVHLYTNIVIIIINLVFSVFGVVTNVLVLSAYAMNKRLRTSSNMLLVVLAISDLMVTAVVQPLYVARKIQEIFGSNDCLLEAVIEVASLFCCGVSLMTVVILSVERFVTLAYPYHYQNIITPTRLKATVTSLWILILAFAVSQPLRISPAVVLYIGATIILFDVSIVVSIWLWIHRLICQHQSRIENCHKPSDVTSEIIKCQKMLGTTKTSYLIVTAVFLCYFPIFAVIVWYLNEMRSFSIVYLILPWTNTLMYGNSSLNPLLLFWRRQSFRDTIRKAFCKRV